MRLPTRFLPAIALGCTLLCGQPAASAADEPAPAPKAEAKVAPILLMALSSLGKTLLDQAVEHGIFYRLFASLLGLPPEASPGKARDRQADRLLDDAGKASAAAGLPADALIPALGFSVEQIDPYSFTLIKAHPLQHGMPRMKTGDVFAMHYSTSLPGVVQVLNIDPKGVTTSLGRYTVRPDQDNRIPEGRQGIGLSGAPGTEILRVLFYPCRPADTPPLPQTPAARLPACDTAPAALDAALAAPTRQRPLKALAQPEDTLAFFGSADYQAGEVGAAQISILHD